MLTWDVVFFCALSFPVGVFGTGRMKLVTNDVYLERSLVAQRNARVKHLLNLV